MFVMRLSHSGRAFHVAFGTQAHEAFLEGHVLAFQHFGGVPGRVRYDNLKPAVVRVLKGRDRTESERFTGQPVVLLGDSGTGKSHPLIGLGLAACEQGRRVRYVTTAQLVNEVVEAADERQLSRVVGRYRRLDLLCLDELGYVQIDPRGAELLFQIITEREERASIAIATSLPFSEWGSVFPNPLLAAAIVDRVTLNAHIVETGTQSYRLRTSKTTTRRKRAS